MASGDQLKALIRSHTEGDRDHFRSVALQVAATEAKSGHSKLAKDLRDILDKNRNARPPVSEPRSEIGGLLEVSHPKTRLSEMIVSETLGPQIAKVLTEQRHAAKILEHGLSPRRKLLLAGPPGTGKTMTASVLAGELGLPLLQVRLDALTSRFMGETAARLRQIFDFTQRTRGVYLFDEFDGIGSQRGTGHDVGEIRRVLNSFLAMLEQDKSHSLVLAATNLQTILDYALFRRFDDVLRYDLPDEQQTADLMRTRLSRTAEAGTDWKKLAGLASGLSYADIARVCDDTLKDSLMCDVGTAEETAIAAMIAERREIACIIADTHGTT